MSFGKSKPAKPQPPAPTPEELEARKQRRQEVAASKERATRVGGAQTTQVAADETTQAADMTAANARKKASRMKP